MFISKAALRRPLIVLAATVLLSLLLSACVPPGGPTAPTASTTSSTTTTNSGGAPGFPSTPPQLRVPTFGSAGQEAPTVKVLPSVAPTVIIQFPLVPVSIKTLFPKASGLVTVIQGNPSTNDFDTVTVDVQNMPPNVKFTVFFTEIAVKPFGHAEYVGDVITRGDGTGESVFHLITFVAFAADNRKAGISTDQSGDASGIQLEHVGMWFDGVNAARQVLNNPTIPGTPFDGGHGVLHAGPQAMTDGQTLAVI